MKILFLGDYCISQKYKLDDSVVNLLNRVDYSILNLEGPFFYQSKNLPYKFGPRLYNDVNTFIKNFSDKNIIVAGANNHIYDYGPDGVLETIKILKKNKFQYFGFGKNIHDAQKPIILNDIVIYNFAENEFGASTNNSPGFSNYNLSLIEKIKKDASKKKILIYFHGGTEYCSVPNPFIRNLFDSLLESGVVSIIGSHPHIPQKYHYFNNQFLCYSLGNFLFKYEKKTIKNFLRKLIFKEFIPKDTFSNYGIGIELHIHGENLKYEVHKFKFLDGTLKVCNDKIINNLLNNINSYDSKMMDLEWSLFAKKIMVNYQKYYKFNLRNSDIAKINFNNTESHKEILKILFSN